jgi:hypothetical protein
MNDAITMKPTTVTAEITLTTYDWNFYHQASDSVISTHEVDKNP